MSTNPLEQISPTHSLPTILYVDDEEKACKWLSRLLADEFRVLTAQSAMEALGILQNHGHEIRILLTDLKMPQLSGLDLLRLVQTQHQRILRILVTAHGDKNTAVQAINENLVFKFIEKPLQNDLTRQILQEALRAYEKAQREHELHRQRVGTLSQTLSFLAHELNTPLTTVRTCIEVLRRRQDLTETDPQAKFVRLEQYKPLEIQDMLEMAERRALYCQSLISTFAQNAFNNLAHLENAPTMASQLVANLMTEYPFAQGEGKPKMSYCVKNDFALPEQRDLLYLVLCTLTQNALKAVDGQPNARLDIVLELDRQLGQAPTPCIRFVDNGPGIRPDLLQRLTHERINGKDSTGQSGMGLVLTRRVMQSFQGDIRIESEVGEGTQISLLFPASSV